MQATKLKKKMKTEEESMETRDDEEEEMGEGESQQQLPGDKISTATVARGAESSLHTVFERLELESGVRFHYVYIFL